MTAESSDGEQKHSKDWEGRRKRRKAVHLRGKREEEVKIRRCGMEVVCPASSLGPGCQPDLILFDRNGQTHFAGAKKKHTHTLRAPLKKKEKVTRKHLTRSASAKHIKNLCAVCACVSVGAFPAAV